MIAAPVACVVDASLGSRGFRSMTVILGQGVYSFAEAAKLVGLSPARVREWFLGRASGNERNPVFTGDYQPVQGDFAISFHDLIDVYVAGQLREHGVSLQTVRRVYRRMQDDLQTDHPFCRKELLSDGKAVFLRGLDSEGQEELVEVLTRQKVFPQVLLPFLQRIDYEKVTLLARRWRIARMVVVDPAICFGKPIVEAVGIPTAVLAAAYFANDKDAGLVADWYNVHADHILAAVEFERNLVA
jgi:uncharacterized protein (DUF433 family)